VRKRDPPHLFKTATLQLLIGRQPANARECAVGELRVEVAVNQNNADVDLIEGVANSGKPAASTCGGYEFEKPV
jgi:orotate phosphoribosyltransferase-like protein